MTMLSVPAATAPAMRRTSWIWLAAMVGAVVVHAVALLFLLSPAAVDDSDDALGAPAIDVSLEFAAPQREDDALPPGPETEAASASLAAREQHEKIEKLEAPKEQPTESSDPDRLVAPELAHKEESRKVEESKANPAIDSVASEATAPPRIEAAAKSETTTAPAQGLGESARLAQLAWQKTLVAHIDRHKRYPATGTQRSVQVVVTFTLDRLGHLVAADVTQSSGDLAFDAAAIAMLRSSDPMPPPPPLVADTGRLTFTRPVIFRARRP